MPMMFLGGTAVLMREYHPVEMLRTIEKERTTAFFGPAIAYLAPLQATKAAGLGWDSFELSERAPLDRRRTANRQGHDADDAGGLHVRRVPPSLRHERDGALAAPRFSQRPGGEGGLDRPGHAGVPPGSSPSTARTRSPGRPGRSGCALTPACASTSNNGRGDAAPGVRGRSGTHG